MNSPFNTAISLVCYLARLPLLCHQIPGLPVTTPLCPPFTLAFPAYGLAMSNTPLLALGHEKALSPHRAQDAISGHLLAKAFQQVLL